MKGCAHVPVSDLFAQAERQQREALTPEKMRGNPGFGKPLHLKDNPYDQGMGMAYRMLRNAGFTRLPWMEDEEAVARGRAELSAALAGHLAWLRDAASGIGGQTDRAAAALARHREALGGLRAQAEALRRRIERFNLTVPIAGRQVMNVNPDRVVAELMEGSAPALGVLEAAAAGRGAADPAADPGGRP